MTSLPYSGANQKNATGPPQQFPAIMVTITYISMTYYVLIVSLTKIKRSMKSHLNDMTKFLKFTPTEENSNRALQLVVKRIKQIKTYL